MKKTLFSIMVLAGISANAQIGINTANPRTTMDVSAKRDASGTLTDDSQLIGLQAPRLTRTELTASSASYGTNQKGALIFITDISGGNTSGQRGNIDAIGYYYFDGSFWQKITKNIYNSDGALTEDRDLNLNGNSLNLIGTEQTVTFNEGGWLTLASQGTDSAFMRLTTADVNGNGHRPRFDMQMFADNYLQMFAVDEANSITFGTHATLHSSPIQFVTSSGNGALGETRMTITGEGNVGIGTDDPDAKLHIVGSDVYTAFQMQDGSEGTNKVLISDAQGKATWATSSSVIPTILGILNTTSKVVTTTMEIGSSLTLPPGRWLVYVGQLVTSTVAATSTNNKWMRITLSSSSSSVSTTNFSFLGSSLASGWLAPSISSSGGFSFLSGVMPIQVNSSVTLHTWFDANSSVGTPPASTIGTNGENYLFAVPMN